VWIESHQSLARHPKTLRLARLLNTSAPAAIGHLHMLWWWCLEYADDGDVTGFEAGELAFAAMWEGDAATFIDALIGAGFIDVGGDGRRHVHDWEEYAGKVARRRKTNAERMRAARAQHVGATESACSPAVFDDRTGQDTTGQERTGESADAEPTSGTLPEKGRRATKTPASFALDDEQYAAAAGLGFTRQRADDETAKFLDWHRSRGSAFVDWHAAWRNWMRNAQRFGVERRSKNGHHSDEAYAAAFDRLMDGDVIEGAFS
jgi:hypothetical protein